MLWRNESKEWEEKKKNPRALPWKIASEIHFLYVETKLKFNSIVKNALTQCSYSAFKSV